MTNVIKRGIDRVITITLNREEILEDIESIAHVVGRRIQTAENADKVADIQTPEEGVDRYIVARAMSKAFSSVKAKCARYVNSGRLIDNNMMEDIKGTYVLELIMPDNWNIGVATELTNTIHDYVVNACMYSLFEKTLPDEAQQYLEQAMVEIQQIKSLLEYRTSPTRRPLNLY